MYRSLVGCSVHNTWRTKTPNNCIPNNCTYVSPCLLVSLQILVDTICHGNSSVLYVAYKGLARGPENTVIRCPPLTVQVVCASLSLTSVGQTSLLPTPPFRLWGFWKLQAACPARTHTHTQLYQIEMCPCGTWQWTYGRLIQPLARRPLSHGALQGGGGGIVCIHMCMFHWGGIWEHAAHTHKLNETDFFTPSLFQTLTTLF